VRGSKRISPIPDVKPLWLEIGLPSTKAVDVLLYAFETAITKAPAIAAATAERWKAFWLTRQYGVFGRLYLLAAKKLSLADVAAELLTADPDLLWSTEAASEVQNFLVAGWDIMSTPVRQDLENVLRGGPPRSLYRKDLSVDKYAKYSTDESVRLLSILQSHEAALDIASLDVLTKYKGELDGLRPLSSPVGEARFDQAQSAPSAGTLVGRSASEIAKAVAEYVGAEDLSSDSDFSVGIDAGELLANVIKAEPQRAGEIVEALIACDERRPLVWGGLLVALCQVTPDDAALDQCILAKLLEIFSKAPEVVDRSTSGYAAWVASLAEKSIDDSVFWGLWDLGSHSALVAPSNIVEDEPSVDGALNAPAGRLVQAAIARRWRDKPRAGEGLGGVTELRLTRLLGGDMIGARYARIQAIRWLRHLFWLDPNWTQRNLLALMVWEDYPATAKELWLGFLFAPSVSPDLFFVLKPALLNALTHCGEFDQRVSLNATRLLAAIVAADPEAFTHEESMNGVRHLGSEGAYHLLDSFVGLLRNNDNPAELWRRSVGPWLARHWPPDQALRTGKIFAAAAELAIETADAFLEATETLWQKNLGGKMRESSMFFHRLKMKCGLEKEVPAYNLAEEYAARLAYWLDQVLPMQISYWERESLRSVAAKLEQEGVSAAVMSRLRERLL
jgi:hypothetical protein